MKKKILALILCVVMVIGILPVYAFAEDGLSDWTYNVLSEADKTAEVTGYTGSLNKIEVPFEINGYTITKIADNAFRDTEQFISIHFYENITEIGNYAFYGCKSQDIGSYGTMPNNVKVIGDYAFANSKIKYFNLPVRIESIGKNALYGSLFYLGNSNWYNDRLYSNCPDGRRCLIAVRNLNPENVFEVDWLTLVIADGVFPEGSVARITRGTKHIGDGNEFDTIIGYDNSEAQRYASATGCSFTRMENYPDWTYNVLSEEEKTAELTGYLGEEKDITLPSTVDGYTMVSVADNAFSYFNLLDSVSFKGYFDIEKITIPDSYKRIGEYAIYEMSYLEDIELPDSLEYVGWYSLQKCLFANRIGYELARNKKPEVYYKDGCCFFAAQNEKMPRIYSVNPGTRIITSGAFCNTKYMYQIIFPEGLEHITEGAFVNCRALRSAVIPNSVKELQKWTFCASDNRFNAVYISPGVTKIDENFVMREMDYNMNYTNELSDFLTIYGEEGSYAEQFANEHGITFIASKDIIYGDIDGDGTVTVSDYAAAESVAVNETKVPDGNAEIVGDMNRDCIIDAFDAAAIDRVIVG